MASLSYTHFLSLPRWQSNLRNHPQLNFVQLQDFRLQHKWGLAAISRKKISEALPEEEPSDNDAVGKKKTTKRTTSRTRKKTVANASEEDSELVGTNDTPNEEKKTTRTTKRTTSRTRKKTVTDASEENPELVEINDASNEEKKTTRTTKRATSRTRKKTVADASEEDSELVGTNDTPNEEKKTTGTTKRTTSRTRKKTVADASEEKAKLVGTDDTSNEEVTVSVSGEDSKKPRRTRRKDASASTSLEEEETGKVVRKRQTRKKQDEEVEAQDSETEKSNQELSEFVVNLEDESDGDLEFDKDDGEDITYTYGWPPLVCCFGAAQHAFVPTGRPANRLLNYEIHDRMRDAYWEPEKFMRAPGGSAGGVAISLASLGGKVAFMGKLGDDEFGRAMLYYMNVNDVQTRSVRVDGKRATALSQMKISKRGRLRATCVKPCAEDSLLKSELNMDVLKQAKMFYFNTHSLLDQSMRSTAFQAIKISKKLGAVVFYDLNLPLPLWQSNEETKLFIQQAWNLANIIEITKQELEFLCGIEPTEEFDTRKNTRSKFVHYGPEVVAPLWHENLEVLFVTNGTSKIHYYTKEHNGSVHGMEDPPLTPFTSDMSASGDGIIAGMIRMLSVEPDLITDEEYLQTTVKYAINCGVIDQWLLGRTRGFPPREEMEDEVEPDENGIRSKTEREYRTLENDSDPVGEMSVPEMEPHQLEESVPVDTSPVPEREYQHKGSWM